MSSGIGAPAPVLPPSAAAAAEALAVQIAAGSTELITPTQEATVDLATTGTKATIAVTLVAWGTWADGLTIAVPGVPAHTIKKTSAGDIDVRGAADIAAAAAIVGAFMAGHAGSLVDYVGTVGQVMTFRAKSVGRALNGRTVAGTLLTADVAANNGVAPYDGRAPGEVLIDGWEPTANATAHNFPITPSAWRSLRMVVGGAQNPLVKMLVDGSAPAGTVVISSAGATPSSANWSATNIWGDAVPLQYLFVLGRTNCMTSILSNTKTGSGKHALPTTSVGVSADPTYPFVGGDAWVELYGVPR